MKPSSRSGEATLLSFNSLVWEFDFKHFANTLMEIFHFLPIVVHAFV